MSQTVADLLEKGTRHADIEGRVVTITNGYYAEYRGTVVNVAASGQVQVRLLLSSSLYYFPPADLVMDETPASATCNHKLELYTGLTDQYNHCSKCGIKESDIKVSYSYEWENV